MFKKFLAVVSITLAFLMTSCGGSNEKLLLGGWYSEMSYPIPADKNGMTGEIKLRGIQSYLANKATSFDGQMILVFHYPQGQAPFNKLEIAYDANITGDWEIKDKSIFTKIVDLKFHPSEVKIDDQLIDNDDQKNTFFAEM